MITKTESIVEQLVDIYYKEEWWHTTKMDRENAIKYHTNLYNQGNIQVYEQDGQVLGYFEVWLISYAQFGRLVCHERFCATDENIISGNIAYVANTWVHPDYRNSHVSKNLIRRWFAQCHHCQYFVGSALRKKTQPIKVFRKEELKSSLFREGVMQNGKY